jgi:hypothetical protein
MMRLGVKFQNGNTGMGALGMYLRNMKGKALVQFHGADAIFERFPKRFQEFWKVSIAHLNLPGDYLYMMDADGMSNTVTVTVPMAKGKEGMVEMSYDEYDSYIKRKGWPYAIVDVTDIVSFDMVNFNEASDLLPQPTAESEPGGAADSG